MKSLFHCLGCAAAALLLLASPTQCFAMMSSAQVTKAKAKAMGIDLRTRAAGPDALWVELEFKTEGDLKSFGRVDVEIREDGHPDGKLLFSAPLKELRAAAGHIVVGFTITRAKIDKAEFHIIAGIPMDLVSYNLRLKDFIDKDAPAIPAEKPAAAPAPAGEKPASK